MSQETFSATYYGVYWLVYLAFAAVTVTFFTRVRLRSALKIVLGNICIVLGILGLAFLIGEGYFLFFYDETDTFGFVRVSHRWTVRHVHRNGSGFREEFPITPRIRAEELRIGILGDSFTFGQGIEDPHERFTNLLNARLSGQTARPVVVYNFSLRGWNTADQVTFCRAGLPVLDLDMVILAYVMNDLIDLTIHAAELEHLAGSRPEWAMAIGRHSLFVDFLLARAFVFGKLDQRGYGFLSDAYADPATWNTQRERLLELVECARANNTPLGVVIFPMFDESWSEYSLRDDHEKVDELFQRMGIETIDLLPFFDDRRARDYWVNRFDAHPNELAHEIVANAIHDRWFSRDARVSSIRSPEFRARARRTGEPAIVSISTPWTPADR